VPSTQKLQLKPLVDLYSAVTAALPVSNSDLTPSSLLFILLSVLRDQDTALLSKFVDTLDKSPPADWKLALRQAAASYTPTGKEARIERATFLIWYASLLPDLAVAYFGQEPFIVNLKELASSAGEAQSLGLFGDWSTVGAIQQPLLAGYPLADSEFVFPTFLTTALNTSAVNVDLLLRLKLTFAQLPVELWRQLPLFNATLRGTPTEQFAALYALTHPDGKPTLDAFLYWTQFRFQELMIKVASA
jgi:nitrate reductase NapE component